MALNQEWYNGLSKDGLVVKQEEGVHDIAAFTVKAYFVKALIAERSGDDKSAAEFLDKAIVQEEKANAGK